jgi:hypothetical protein
MHLVKGEQELRHGPADVLDQVGRAGDLTCSRTTGTAPAE